VSPVSQPNEALLRAAIELSRRSIGDGGGPFGAVIARDGVVVARGTNRVVPDHDPTAHAEVAAIRAACRSLGTHDLTGCAIYASCEPCPMCLAAIMWARIDHLWFAADRRAAAAAGFDDAHFYDELPLPPTERELPSTQLLADEAAAVLTSWRDKPNKTAY
jgi:guanine deaminase